jgi:hypothetical protein
MSAPTEQEMREFLVGFADAMVRGSGVIALVGVLGQGSLLERTYRTAKAMDAVAGDAIREMKREEVERN